MKACVLGKDLAIKNSLTSMRFFITDTYYIHPMDPQLCEKAKEMPDFLRVHNFRASKGWLDRCKKRYNVKKMKIIGEARNVRGEMVDSWKERLPELLQGFLSYNIWNLDETTCFWRALHDHDHGFEKKKSQWIGGKKTNWVTIALLVNADRQMEDTIVIWKS